MGTTITSNHATPVKLRRPVKTKETNDDCFYTYFNSETKKWETVGFYKKHSVGRVYIDITEQISKHAFENHGVISKTTALNMLQELFMHNAENLVNWIKNLFELYMDKDSEGGENITQNEQYKIMTTLANWYND